MACDEPLSVEESSRGLLTGSLAAASVKSEDQRSDACRNNPLARSMQRTVASRSVSGGSFGQLDEDLLEDETLVAYAAAAGTTAAGGTGRNSPYTTEQRQDLQRGDRRMAGGRRLPATSAADAERAPRRRGAGSYPLSTAFIEISAFISFEIGQPALASLAALSNPA